MDYTVYQKVTLFVLATATTLIGPLWPGYVSVKEARARF